MKEMKSRKLDTIFGFMSEYLPNCTFMNPPSSPIIYIYFEKELMFGRHSLTKMAQWSCDTNEILVWGVVQNIY